MKKTNIYQLCVCALMAAIMCVLGPHSIPIGPVPVSLTNLVLYFTVFIIGTQYAFVSYVIYLLLGLVGLPVFSNFSGGLAKLAGPTGGYLIGFLFMILICGIVMEKTNYNIIFTILGDVLATAVAYAFGTAWFVFLAKCTLGYALTVCVVPFIGFDFIKIVVAVIIGKQVRKALLAAHLLETREKKAKTV